jgi:hypothetical protein
MIVLAHLIADIRPSQAGPGILAARIVKVRLMG